MEFPWIGKHHWMKAPPASSPTFAMIAKGLPLAIATLATVALLIGGIFGKAGCGYLADRIGVRPAFALAQMLTALNLVVAVAALACWP